MTDLKASSNARNEAAKKLQTTRAETNEGTAANIAWRKANLQFQRNLIGYVNSLFFKNKKPTINSQIQTLENLKDKKNDFQKIALPILQKYKSFLQKETLYTRGRLAVATAQVANSLVQLKKEKQKLDALKALRSAEQQERNAVTATASTTNGAATANRAATAAAGKAAATAATVAAATAIAAARENVARARKERNVAIREKNAAISERNASMALHGASSNRAAAEAARAADAHAATVKAAAEAAAKAEKAAKAAAKAAAAAAAARANSQNAAAREAATAAATAAAKAAADAKAASNAAIDLAKREAKAAAATAAAATATAVAARANATRNRNSAAAAQEERAAAVAERNAAQAERIAAQAATAAAAATAKAAENRASAATATAAAAAATAAAAAREAGEARAAAAKNRNSAVAAQEAKEAAERATAAAAAATAAAEAATAAARVQAATAEAAAAAAIAKAEAATVAKEAAERVTKTAQLKRVAALRRASEEADKLSNQELKNFEKNARLYLNSSNNPNNTMQIAFNKVMITKLKTNKNKFNTALENWYAKSYQNIRKKASEYKEPYRKRGKLASNNSKDAQPLIEAEAILYRADPTRNIKVSLNAYKAYLKSVEDFKNKKASINAKRKRAIFNDHWEDLMKKKSWGGLSSIREISNRVRAAAVGLEVSNQLLFLNKIQPFRELLNKKVPQHATKQHNEALAAFKTNKLQNIETKIEAYIAASAQTPAPKPVSRAGIIGIQLTNKSISKRGTLIKNASSGKAFFKNKEGVLYPVLGTPSRGGGFIYGNKSRTNNARNYNAVIRGEFQKF